MDITNLISTVGFPIACVVVLGYFINNFISKNREDGIAREKSLMDANKEFAIALNKSSDAIIENGKTQIMLLDKMQNMESKVDGLVTSVEVIKVSIMK